MIEGWMFGTSATIILDNVQRTHTDFQLYNPLLMYRYIDWLTDVYTDCLTERCTDCLTDWQIYRLTDIFRQRQTDHWTDTVMQRQTDWQMALLTDRQTVKRDKLTDNNYLYNHTTFNHKFNAKLSNIRHDRLLTPLTASDTLPKMSSGMACFRLP